MINKVGEAGINRLGNKMTIIRYIDSRNCDVQFEDGYVKNKVNYYDFKKGSVKSAYDKTVFGVGYLGDGSYKAKTNKKKERQYISWKDMIRRCYDPKMLERNKTYIHCSVCDEWLNYQIYAKWYDENFYEIGSNCMNLDKDILKRGNKIYSPDSCCFVPQDINKLFVTRKSMRGNNPIGVSYHNRDKRYRSYLNADGKITHLGYFSNKIDAFNCYKLAKESEIKRVAEKYKNSIPRNLYEVMCNYEVRIDD